MKKISILFLTAAGIFLFNSCKERTSAEIEKMPVVTVKTETVRQGDIEKNIGFNGKTIYLKKNVVVSPIAGYIVKAAARFGEDVKRGDLLFEIQTKESKALGSDSSFSGNIGTINVRASSEGFISELTINETGGYVVEGGALCSIADNNDLMVKLNVPFEYNALIRAGKRCTIILPDETSVDGVVNKVLPVIDEASQTQSILIRPGRQKRLPENLNLTIVFVQEEHTQTNLVSRNSLMTNETQSEFWVMKITSDTIAVRVPVLKGIENESVVEISSPLLNKNDLVISEGAYGLADSTVVKIEN